MCNCIVYIQSVVMWVHEHFAYLRIFLLFILFFFLVFTIFLHNFFSRLSSHLTSYGNLGPFFVWTHSKPKITFKVSQFVWIFYLRYMNSMNLLENILMILALKSYTWFILFHQSLLCWLEPFIYGAGQATVDSKVHIA